MRLKNDVDILLEAIKMFSYRSMFGPRKTWKPLEHFRWLFWYKNEKRNEKQIFVSHYASDSSQNSFSFEYDFLSFFLSFLLNRALLNFRPFTLSSFFNTIKCRCDNTIKIVFLSSFISASVFNEQRNVYTGYHHLRRNLQIKLKRKFLCVSSFSRWTVASI